MLKFTYQLAKHRHWYLEINSTTNAIFLTIQLIRAIILILRRVQRFVNAIHWMRQLIRTIMSNDQVSNKSYSEKISDDQSHDNAIFLMIQSIRKQFDIMTRSTSNAHCKYNFFDKAIDSKTIVSKSRRSCSHHDLVSSILCCLLSRTYDAWKVESCQKHFQKLLSDLIERWVLWMNVKWKQKIEKIFEIWCIQCDRVYSTSLAINHFFSKQLIDFNIKNKKNKK